MNFITPSVNRMRRPVYYVGLIHLLGLLASPAVHAEGSFLEAITGGKVSGQLRPRFESVTQEGKSDKASAFTLRTQLGYATNDFQGFGAFVQFEDIRNLGSSRYNDTINGLTQYPTVADPESTEINQGFISYKGGPDTLLADTTIRYGRQIINLDNQRFIGSVGWRQNSQTFDAFSVTSAVTNNVNVFFAHVTNTNRIFGQNSSQGDVRLNGELLNIAYRGFKPGTLIGYAYLLDYAPGQPIAVTASNKTLGLRFDGWHQPEGGAKFFYTAEYANQSDYKNGASTVGASYRNLVLGAEVKTVQVKLNYEVLGGDGVYGFATPFATGHAFNGWADQFLTTPRDGLQDIFITLEKSWKGIHWLARYDRYSSDTSGYDYGSELGLQASKKVNKNLTLLAKYADYSGDTNSTNVARNLTLSRDLSKFWLQADFQF
ncbi:MAG: alginate export family protein [Gammaproteobacteria bacterium]|nr:alginate export family protein [Gammaproteobacteria bacterium]